MIHNNNLKNVIRECLDEENTNTKIKLFFL
jgi:hypothetical protein